MELEKRKVRAFSFSRCRVNEARNDRKDSATMPERSSLATRTLAREDRLSLGMAAMTFTPVKCSI